MQRESDEADLHRVCVSGIGTKQIVIIVLIIPFDTFLFTLHIRNISLLLMLLLGDRCVRDWLLHIRELGLLFLSM